jgi:hypothetical protein
MLASIVFITAVFGAYEKTAKLRHPQDIEADWICFTNHTKLLSNGWQLDFTPYHLTHPSPLDDGRMINTYQNKSHPVHPFLAAKYYKQAFQNIPRLKRYDVVVWIDGTVEIKVPTVASFLMNKIMNQSYPMVGFHHEMRQGQMWPEVAASYAEKYYGENWLGWKQPVQDVIAQYRQYLRNGYNYAYWNRNRKRVKNTSQHVSRTDSIAFEFLTLSVPVANEYLSGCSNFSFFLFQSTAGLADQSFSSSFFLITNY